MFVGTIQATASIMDRYMGYQKAMIENHLEDYSRYVYDRPLDEKFIFVEVPETIPEVFMCNNDFTAYTLILELQKQGYKVPEDVKVTGFDDTLYAKLSKPMITTKHVDLEETAKTAIKFITKKIDNKKKKYGRVIVDTKRVDRDSFKFE